jgi:hypothetical protein
MPTSTTLALDVAILLPEPAASVAIDISRDLAGDRQDALRLDDRHLPHVTLLQQFVEVERADEAVRRAGSIVTATPRFTLKVSGFESYGRTVVLALEHSPDLQRLHEALLEGLAEFEGPPGDISAFKGNGEEAREGDVEWVRDYRAKASGKLYSPHVTLGHGDLPKEVAPFAFAADRVAACHLGRFCTCRTVLREWDLAEPHSQP